MSIPNERDIREVEEALHKTVQREFAARDAELKRAGLRPELDAIHRSGVEADYESYIEATLRFEEGDVHDVVFFHVARHGRLAIDPAVAADWVTTTIDGILKDVPKATPSP